jgi:transposase
MGRQRRKKQERRAAQREVHLAELAGIVERAKSALGEDDYATLKSAIETLAFLTQEIAAKRTSIDRLRKMLFGTSSEKTSHVTGNEPKKETASKPGDEGGEKPKRPGHGRNGAAAYTGAQKVKVTHLLLGHGDACPECEKGKVYPMAEPQVLLRVRGMAPIVATVYECDRLRCNLCGEIFTASAPPGVGDEKYDATAAAMVALLKYGAGLPFYRIEKLQAGFGIPLPTATQWEIVARMAKLLEPAHDELLNQAAQADLVHNDDTAAKILELGSTSSGDAPADDGDDDERTGVFTSAIVAEGEQHRIALFFTGQKHAGENLADVLARRRAELAVPIQMCDALSRNLPGEIETIIANCICHARRKFVDVVNDFPDEVRHLLETLREVYKIDAQAREQGLSPDERLRLHQIESAPLMEALEKWLRALIDERKVEPNSGLGEAIGYMLKHWTKLTLFLRVPGAPLDNNICERALKKAILHRKNALFYKTQNGAHVGDVFMSLIHSAELNRVGAFDYLVALQRHHEDVAAEPGEWMPWNYHAALARLAESAPPS